MTEEQFHYALAGGVVAAAVGLLWFNRKNAKATNQLVAIAQAATTPPAVTGASLPDYVKSNIAPWGQNTLPFLPGQSLVNTSNLSDLEYGSYYSN